MGVGKTAENADLYLRSQMLKGGLQPSSWLSQVAVVLFYLAFSNTLSRCKDDPARRAPVALPLDGSLQLPNKRVDQEHAQRTLTRELEIGRHVNAL